MKITIVYDNTSTRDDLISDWGFSCVVELPNRKILFDTGGNGRILLENMCTLNINPISIDDIVISHSDFDHIGGLSHFLNLNDSAVIHNPVSFRGIKYPNEVKYYKKPTEIYPGVFVTGELGNREQSLAIKSEKGLILIIGCGHPGVSEIIESLENIGKIYAIVGGLHGFDDFKVLEDIDVVCPTHCTKHADKIEELYPEKCISGGVGKVIEF